MKILYVDATVRSCSRTAELADHLLEKLGGSREYVKLENAKLPHIDAAFIKRREELAAKKDFSDGIFDNAKQFAAADIIVIAAPFWDLSFPAVLKQYLEQVCVVGLTFEYNSEGVPVGLCRAKKLFYVTTAGGRIYSEEYGFGYVKSLARTFFGIDECVMFKAEGLDTFGTDVKAVMDSAKAAVAAYFEPKAVAYDELVFGELGEGDLEEAYTLCKKNFSEVPGFDEVRTIFNECRDDPHYHFVVGRYDGKIVAYATMVIFQDLFDGDDPISTLWFVCVDEAYRRRGIARQLLAEIDRIAMENNSGTIYLTCEYGNEAAMQLYRSAGYVEDEEKAFIRYPFGKK